MGRIKKGIIRLPGVGFDSEVAKIEIRSPFDIKIGLARAAEWYFNDLGTGRP